MQTQQREVRSYWRALKLAGPYPAIGVVGGLLIAAITPKWQLDYHPWRITLPGIPHDGVRPFTPIAFVVGMVALGVAWAGLLIRMERSHAPTRDLTRAVLITAALWFIPVMLGPPLLSSDVYSYAAQGEMLTRGIDPTSEEMSRLQYGNFLAHVDTTWRNSKGNPYGPVGMGLAAAVVTTTGHDPDRAVWGMRLLAVAGVALAAWGIHDLAKRHGLSPPSALAFAIANPIVVIHLVGGGHNEAVMMGLLCAGCAMAHRQWRWGVVLITAAALVKLPAAAGLVYLAWNRQGATAAIRDRLKVAAEALGIAAAVTLVACRVVGIGFGWIGAMRNSAGAKGTLSLTTKIGYAVSRSLQAVGISVDQDTAIDVTRLFGLVVAMGGCFALMLYSGRLGAVRATGLAILLVVLLGPVVWPWYFAPALALLGATGMGNWRPSIVVLSAAFAAEILPAGNNASPVLEHQHLAGLLVILLIGAAALLAPRAVRWHTLRYPHAHPIRTAEDDGLAWAGTPSA